MTYCAYQKNYSQLFAANNNEYLMCKKDRNVQRNTLYWHMICKHIHLEKKTINANKNCH